MNRFLYLMHIPWTWIKQRPQFLAEELSKFYNISVIPERETNQTPNVVINHKTTLNFLSYPRINLLKGKTGAFLNYWIRKIVVLYSVANSDVIWITYPTHWSYVKEFITRKKIVVYDCMDDMPAFYSDKKSSEILIKLENKICQRADLIIASAESLKNVLVKRHNLKRSIIVLNNAITIPNHGYSYITEAMQRKYFNNPSIFTMIYIGTISSWFDFDSIIYCLDNISDIRFLIFGPVECELPSHPRMIYGGILEHSKVFDVMAKASLLIMPFKLTPLVLSVNPVKAYEYIFSAKPVVLVKYKETEKFSKFVNLYETKMQLLDLINRIKNKGNFVLRTSEECYEFAQNNTWERRSEEIKNTIDTYLRIRN